MTQQPTRQSINQSKNKTKVYGQPTKYAIQLSIVHKMQPRRYISILVDYKYCMHQKYSQ